MEQDEQNQDVTPSEMASVRAGNGGIVPPIEHRFKLGWAGGPGRPTAGASIREHINIMAAQELSENDLRKIARDKGQSWNKRTAAERMLRTLEAGDLADYEGLMRGEDTLVELRKAGHNTEVVKKMKTKRRTIKQEAGPDILEVETEIELHNRAGDEFDRIVNTTDGTPKSTQESKIEVRALGDNGDLSSAMQAALAQLDAEKDDAAP